jgi:hypothetical protein
MTFTGTIWKHAKTFRTIESRLANFSPPIILRDHIVDNPTTVSDLEVHPLAIQGVDFTLKDPDAFLQAIRFAKTGTENAFAEGSTKPSDWKTHWAMTTSLLATAGIGFREPWRYYLNDRANQIENARPPRMLNAPEFDPGFAANFGTANTIDLSALHISVAFGSTWTECNIHVDETGIVMSDLKNNLSVTPNVGSHFPNELIFKAIIGEHLPTWFIDRVNLHVFSPETGYNRLGLSVDVMKGETYRLTLTATCGLTQCSDVSLSKMIMLDKEAFKAVNPTLTYTRRF